MSRDGVSGLICLALSIGMLVLTRGLPHSPFVPVGPEFYPRIVLVVMMIFSVMLIASDLWRHRTQAAPTVAPEVSEKRNYGLVGMTYVVFTVYVILLPLVGYRVATFLFMFALQPVLEPARTSRRWIIVAVNALATVAITYVVFNDYLSVLLPRGSWTGW